MKKTILLILLPVLLVSILAGCAATTGSGPEPTKQPAQLSSSLSSAVQKENSSRLPVTVNRVVDGDTVEVL